MKRFAVIDIETTGHTPLKGDRIIEIGIVILEDGMITEEYNQFINPNQPISPFITQLTSITDQDVQNQPPFEHVADKIIQLLSDTILIAHNIQFDLNFLNEELIRTGHEKIQPSVIDTVELSRILFPTAPGYKLSELAQFLYITHNQPHRAISDALVTADLFLVLYNKIQTLPKEIQHYFLNFSSNLKSDVHLLISNQTSDESKQLVSINGIILKEMSKGEKLPLENIANFQHFLDAFYGKDGYLDKTFEKYEMRKSQLQMSEIIYDHFCRKEHVIIEAETGIGKSIAYLIPAIYEAKKSQKPIVISTSNINLQTKLIEDDLKQLQDMIDFDIRVSLVKGRQHYLSLEKFEKFLHDNDKHSYHHIMVKSIILVWLTETESGDLDEIQLPSKDQQIRQQLIIDQPTKSKYWKEYCFYERMKERANNADIIVVNHALLSLELSHKSSILPPYSKIILDEAHHFDMIASRYLGGSLHYFELHAFIQHVEGEVPTKELGNELETIKYEIDVLFRGLFEFVRNSPSNMRSFSDQGRMQRIWDISDKKDKDIYLLIDSIQRTKLYLEQFYTSQQDKKWFDSYRTEWRKYLDDLHELLLATQEDTVTWLEIDQNGARNAVYMKKELFTAAKQLSEKLFNQKESVILTSGTLTINHSFHYYIERLGLNNNEINCYQLDTHFTYEDNVQIFVPTDFPELTYPNNDPYIYATCEAIISLASQLNGRMLVLFTSYDMLKKVHDLLKESEELIDYMIIAQGITAGSRNRLIKHFQVFQQSILLGTNAYWEGIDIPGNDLSCVVIVKLPFQSPYDPVFVKQSMYYKQQGKNPFVELSLPKAVFQFKQGFGRLVRKETDKGIIFVLDHRIMTKQYGTTFIHSIPKVPIHYDSIHSLINKVNDWI